MKRLFGIFLFLIFVSGSASAEIFESIVCTSEKPEHLYDTSGEIHLTAEVINPLLLRSIVLTTTSSRLGLRVTEVKGLARGKWARFELGSDAFCSYKLALPKDFNNRRLVPGFLDTRCRASLVDSFSMSCQIR